MLSRNEPGAQDAVGAADPLGRQAEQAVLNARKIAHEEAELRRFAIPNAADVVERGVGFVPAVECAGDGSDGALVIVQGDVRLVDGRGGDGEGVALGKR